MRMPFYPLMFILITSFALPLQADETTDTVRNDENRDYESVTSQIFNIDYYQLDNGIPVITRKRNNNDLFSIQLVVDVGLRDFPCEDRHLPHVVEHVLFEGTETFDGKALRARIFDRGGHWEGYTRDEYTHYTLHIHKNFTDVAIDTLYRMITEPTLSQQDTENAIRAVNAEFGTTSHGLQSWISDTLTIAEQGKNRLYPGTHLACEKRHSPNHLTRSQVERVFRERYVPANFTLMVVGQFDPRAVRQQLNSRFGSLEDKTPPEIIPVAENPIDYTPIVETEKYGDPTAYFQMFIRADGKGEPTQAVWELISQYLTERLFAEIRTQRGIGYTPKVIYNAGPLTGHLEMNVRTTGDWVDQVEAISLEVYRDMKHNGISEADINRLKQRMVYEFEAKERENKNLFQLYRHHTEWIKSQGTMKNLIHEIESVNPESVAQVINRLPERPLTATLRPNSFLEAMLKVIGIVLLAALVALPVYLRGKKRRKTPA
ncbi:MAG: pitrilysin family protein [Ketobacteraceae bacterium]|nr:pitrilysin family protein [Ketobacteraceae bacterium]